MKANLDQLLAELYLADPSLKNHEKVLKPILKHLLAARPEAPIDEQFKTRLREEIWEQIEAVKQKPKHRLLMLPKWAYMASSAALIAVILVPTLLITYSSPTTEQSSPIPSGKGGGGMRSATLDDMAESFDNENALMTPDYIPYTTFNYVYKGDPLVLDGAPAAVYTAEHDESAITKIKSWLSNFDFDLIDLNKFNDLKIAYLNLEPENGSGYSVSIDFNNNFISSSYWDNSNIGMEWDGYNFNKKMPTEKATQIVLDFVEEYDLDLTGYGDLIATEQGVYDGWIDSFMSLTYPIEIEGLTAYEEWGNPVGLGFTVSVENERVDGFWGLSPQNYSSTMYDTISDVNRILAMTSYGGSANYFDPYATNIVEIDLGTPFKTLVKIYDYDESTNVSTERFVPGLVFPITEEYPELYQKNIVVLLVEEFIHNEYPMPLLETKGTEDSTG